MVNRLKVLGLLLGLAVASCSGVGSDDAVYLTVWQYQLASYERSLANQLACVGLRGPKESTVHDPSPEIMAALNKTRLRVTAVSRCGGGPSLVLGPARYEWNNDVFVEGTALEGTYRYHLENTGGGWRVIEGVMLVIY